MSVVREEHVAGRNMKTARDESDTTNVATRPK